MRVRAGAGVTEAIMQAALVRTKRAGRRGMLYPLLVITAISVIIFSALGAAALAGWLPGSDSMRAPARNGGKRSEYMQPASGVFARAADADNGINLCASS